MSTTFLLIRHAAHDRVGSTLCGWMPGVTLGEEGRRQSAALAAHVALYLTDLESLTAEVPGWASMEARIRRDLDSFLERRVASVRS